MGLAPAPSSATGDRARCCVGRGRTRGKRNYMEDMEIVYEHLALPLGTVSLYGVLDGHGGIECVQYLLDELPSTLTARLRSSSQLSIPDALFQTFQATDAEFVRQFHGMTSSGSTANLVVVCGDCLYIANTGDTRAVLGRRRRRDGSTTGTGLQAIDLSFDRKATDSEEIARITQRGGFVINGRVAGSLAVSRAFGDIQLKVGQGALVVDPEVSSWSLSQDDAFIVIATDGLWDVMKSQEVVEFIERECQQEGQLLTSWTSAPTALDEVKTKLSGIAEKLALYAVHEKNSNDNVTVMIVLIASTKPSRPLMTSSSSAAVSSSSMSLTTALMMSRPSLNEPPPVRLEPSPKRDAVISSVKKSNLSDYNILEDDDMAFLQDDSNF